MREAKGSRTARFVAFNRALGNLAPAVPGFSDPIAEKLLPENWTKRIANIKKKLEHSPSASVYPLWYTLWFSGMGIFNQYRTVVLDRAIKSALPFDQMVILGAGFDSRAWRLNELKQAVIFEVDHPDTQELKRAQSKEIHPVAKDVHFVPMDFSSDDLSISLDRADHDPSKSTLWLWEGVTMYLRAQDVGRTLSAMADRSTTGSKVVLTYMSKENGKVPRSLYLYILGEPVRSAYLPKEIASLAKTAGWTAVLDSGIVEWQSDFPSTAPLSRKNAGIQWYERIWSGKR